MRFLGAVCWLALTATAPASSSSVHGDGATDAPCPRDMVLVAGEYCPRVDQRCLQWLESPSLPFARCAKYDQPSVCRSPRVGLRYCIDRFEYTRSGEELPLANQSLNSARLVCQSLGKRVCTEPEWTFACEGEEMRPYPYGFTRRAWCNQDRTQLLRPGKPWLLRDLREPSTARPWCVSPWGVFNLVGNLDEPVLRTDPGVGSPYSGALKGGWWLPGRNRCRAATVGHDDAYRGFQVGIRCCANGNDAH
jgi:formylglycine-generating enzyme required for sulfatase activity